MYSRQRVNLSLLDVLQAATDFLVIVLKTTFTLPYTSLFIQLDCAYWSAESEKKLRAALNHGKRDHPER